MHFVLYFSFKSHMEDLKNYFSIFLSFSSLLCRYFISINFWWNNDNSLKSVTIEEVMFKEIVFTETFEKGFYFMYLFFFFYFIFQPLVILETANRKENQNNTYQIRFFFKSYCKHCLIKHTRGYEFTLTIPVVWASDRFIITLPLPRPHYLCNGGPSKTSPFLPFLPSLMPHPGHQHFVKILQTL